MFETFKTEEYAKTVLVYIFFFYTENLCFW